MDDFSRRGKVEFPVIGMNCGGCANKVKRHLEEIDGVERADVSVDAAAAVVEYDPGKTDVDALKAVVTRLDYKVEAPAIESVKAVVVETGYAPEPTAVAPKVPEIKFSESLKINITGMTCASCSGRVETALKSAIGVSEAAVNLAIENATIRFDPSITSAAELAKVVENAGYGAKIEGEGSDEEATLKRERFTLIISALLTAPLLAQMVSMVLGLGFHLSPWVELALATPVQFLIGSRYYIGAWHALKAKAGNMDMLVAIGTSAAYFYSLWLVLSLGHAAMGLLYFEASTVVITLILAGKYMESRAKRSASSALRQLMGLRPTRATILTPEGEVDTAIEQVKIGDVALLRPGARVPVDGLIVEGESELDEALITGESMPVLRRVGDEVIAGAING
ncbi:MAG TPA: hypothetical protein EYG79_09345, partial [Rhodobacteraceae bacterium]|nr:hypothetical protein [Paracoccaceae bacterium]